MDFDVPFAAVGIRGLSLTGADYDQTFPSVLDLFAEVDLYIYNGQRDGEEVFKKRTSILFKTMQVVRFYDASRNTLIYLTYSDKLVDGSPKNSITAVPLYRPTPVKK
jgi:hypothetical protein